MQHPTARSGLAPILFTALLAAPALPVDPSTPGEGGVPQESEQAPEQAAEETGPQPDRRRLLRLADGSVLRARSRMEDGIWQVREGRDWRPLEVEVVAQRLEREATAEARGKLAALGRDDLDGTVEVATWMLDEGLEAEAVEALDRVLSAEREHAGALALIAARPIELELDLEDERRRLSVERLRALLNAGARGPAAASEVAVQRIAEFERATDLARLVEIELAHANHHHRTFAVLLARRLYPRDFLQLLVDRALLDKYETVRVPAARALGGAEEVAALAPMIRALSSEHGILRLHAIEAMANMGYPAAVEPLMVHLNFLQDSGGPPVGTRANLYIGQQTAIVGDYDVEIAQGASIADPIVGVVESGVVLDVRAVAHIERKIELRAVTGALATLTTEPGRDAPEAWLEWWESAKPHWRSLDLAQ